MKNDPGMMLRARRACAAAVTMVLLSTVTGCESPLSSGATRDDGHYTQSLLNRAILEGAYGRRLSQSSDFSMRDYPRIDSTGPSVPEAATPRLLPVATPGAAPATGPFSAGAPDFDAGMPDADVVLSIEQAEKVGQAAAQLNQPEPRRDLTLQDVIARSMEYALSIKVEAHNPSIREAQVVEAEAALDAVFFGTSQWNKTDEPPLIPTQPGSNNGQTWQNQFGIRRILPSGTQVQAVTNINYHVIDTAGIPNAQLPLLRGHTSSYTANIGIQVIQPLLRSFGTDITQANIYLAQRDYRISLSEFKQKVIATASNVEEAYQNLILARTNVEVLERLVVASQQTFNTVWARRGIDATKASISQAAEALASRRADLLAAQKTYRLASDRLKALMNDPDLDIASNVLINPIDRPIIEPFSYNLDECLDTALKQRPEIQQARLQVERSDIVVRVARNGLLPRLDLTLTAQSNGLKSSPDDAFGQTLDPANLIDFGAGIKFEIPIGNREAESQLRRRVEERKQAIDNIVQVAQQVMLEVKTQLREVYSTYQELQIRDVVRQHAANEFEGILEIESIRPLDPTFLQLKLDTQARLASAEQNLIQTIVNYNLAIMRLEQAKGTLLEFDRISLDRPPQEKAEDGINILRFLGTTWIKDKPIQSQK